MAKTKNRTSTREREKRMKCKNCGHEMLSSKQYFGICGACLQPIWKWKHRNTETFSSIKCEYCNCENPEPESFRNNCNVYWLGSGRKKQ